MLFGLALHPEGKMEKLDSVESLIDIAERKDAVVWADLEAPADADLQAVGQAFHLDPGALDDCLHGEQRPRIDEFDDYLFIMLYGVPAACGDGEFESRKLAAFCSSRFLITIHGEPLGTITTLHDRCTRHGPQILGHGIDSVLYSLIDRMADNYLVVAEGYEDRLDELEEASLDPDVDDTVLADLSALRRKLLELRHLAISQKELILPIAKGEYEFISDALEQRFSHVHDHLVMVIELIERLRELLHGVRDNYHAALAARTNAVVKVLTVFASVLLPMSVVASIYGMNVPLWPPQDHPLSFWGILAVMLAIGGAMLGYLRWRKWI